MRQYIASEIESARGNVASPNEDEATISKQVDDIDAKIDVLIRLATDEEWLDGKITGKPEQEVIKLAPLRTQIMDVKDTLRVDLDGARKALEELENQLVRAGKPVENTRGGQRGGGSDAPSGKPGSTTVDTESNMAKLKQVAWRGLTMIGHFILGVDARAIEQRFWFVKSLLFLVLLIMLALIGLQSLYVNNGAIFGVNGIYDYVGLFLWGMSAEVAQRTLQDLGTPRPSG